MDYQLRNNLRGVIFFLVLNVVVLGIFYIVYRSGHSTLFFGGLSGLVSSGGLRWKIPLFIVISLVTFVLVRDIPRSGFFSELWDVRSVWGRELPEEGIKLYLDNIPLFSIHVLFFSLVYLLYWGIPTSYELIVFAPMVLLPSAYFTFNRVSSNATQKREYEQRMERRESEQQRERETRRAFKPETKPKVVPDQEVVPTAEQIWSICPRRMKTRPNPVLVCEGDYCCVDMVASHWPDSSPRAPQCTNQGMKDFIGKLQREQLYMLRHFGLDEILR